MDKPRLAPKDFFLYVAAMVTLYWSAGALIALLFTITDTVFKDQLNSYVDPYSGGIRFAIASLIVVFPISLILFRAIKRDGVQNPQKLLLGIRKWLYAITIFVTAGALAGDLIALVNGFLGGELTTRFVLKVLSVLAVAGIVFWYCFLEIRVKPESPARLRKEFLWGTTLLVLASVVYGFVVMGSPNTIRKLRFDERRVSDLQQIQWQIVNYWQQKGRFPKSLAELEDPISGYRAPSDPQTKAEYEFALGEGYAFQLCATFNRSTIGEKERLKGRGDFSYGGYPSAPLIANKSGRVESWEHEQERFCFERVLDPDLYPVRSKSI